ncbi:MAG: DUF2095 family protein [Candidatus Hydrothermarchaeales archaeon]
MDELRKKFPNLIKESEGEGLSIKGVRLDAKESAEDTDSKDSGPSIIDFLRRCNNEDEALEIIAYMESRKEIDENYAKKLRAQLLTGGIRSFGSKKEPGYYGRVGRS